jgi:hypothetical protein
LVRVKGSWHPYCSSEWSVNMGTKVCKTMKYTKAVSLSIIGLTELSKRLRLHLKGVGDGNSGEDTETYGRKLLLLGGDKAYTPMTSGPIEEVTTETTIEAGNNCTVGYLVCSK